MPIFLIGFIILLMIPPIIAYFDKVKLKKKLILGRYDAGNAQLKGQQEYMNDYFTIYNDDEALLTAVSDGYLDKIEGSFGAVYAVEALKENFRKRKQYESIQECLKTSFSEIGERLSQGEFGRTPKVSLAAVVFTEDKMIWGGIGDIQILINRKLYINKIFDGGEMTFGEIAIQKRDYFLIVTGGAKDILTQNEYIIELFSNESAYSKAEEIARLIQEKESWRQQNATIAVVNVVL